MGTQAKRVESAPGEAARIRLIVTGRVQGVGFRPTVYRHAVEAGLAGFVKNTPSGVVVELQGPPGVVAGFVDLLKARPPRQARISGLCSEAIAVVAGEDSFSIVPSEGSGDLVVGIPPDLATCDDCVRELFDPSDRRHRYPFLNCTNCGPRFTIVESLPYDRHRTSMKSFELCPRCRDEYGNPADRRFDAQPTACPVCGPQLALLSADGRTVDTTDALAETVRLLKAGDVVALKSLGGYHLCCDARNGNAVATLRDRKGRRDKPFAVMFASIEELRRCCAASPQEEEMLLSSAAPVVVLPRLEDSGLPASLAPDTNDLGAFLPYTPLHHLLLREISPLVMTSGNLSEEPITRDEGDLRRILGRVTRYALTHDRPILRRCDDSVVKCAHGQQILLRRSRGWVPGLLNLPLDGPHVLAVGAEVKNSFCMTRGRQAFLSQHIGDLTEFESMKFFEEAVADLTRLLKIRPAIVAHDLHPDYQSTRYALSREDVRAVPVQHHHAHVAACMAEHGLDGSVVGIALDGTGFGPDGSAWGGEFLVADLRGFRRAAHFKTYPLPGGDEAILHPPRMALSCLVSEFGDGAEELCARHLPSITAAQRDPLMHMVKQGVRSPLTSSAGRLFDAVSALLGLCDAITYEGQAAVRLQSRAGRGEGNPYRFRIEESGGASVLSFGPMIEEILRDLDAGVGKADIAFRFHRTVAAGVVDTCERVARDAGLCRVVLSGGVFQNDLLLGLVLDGLKARALEVYCHRDVPPNDGGLALGQAAVALAIERGG